MQNRQKVHSALLWIEKAQLEPIQIDCITSIMLKILDGKCKMFPQEKAVIALMYKVSKHRQGKFLGADIHRLIASAEKSMDEYMKEKVYEQRLYAETMISRPVMKAFKAMLRENNIIGNV